MNRRGNAVPSASATATPPGPGHRRLGGIAAATLVGTSVEWYDFGIYAVAASAILPTVFFPTMEPAVAVLASFATLAVGPVGRPVGAILFGHISDRHGRRRSLLMSTVLMGIATAVIGRIPGHATLVVSFASVAVRRGPGSLSMARQVVQRAAAAASPPGVPAGLAT